MMDLERYCECDACKLVREMQEKHYGHYLCKYANSLTKESKE